MYRIIKKILDSLKKYEKSISKNDHQEGIKWLLKMIDADKEHNTIVPKAKVNLGKSYRILKQYKDAIKVLEDVVKVRWNICICIYIYTYIYISERKGTKEWLIDYDSTCNDDDDDNYFRW